MGWRSSLDQRIEVQNQRKNKAKQESPPEELEEELERQTQWLNRQKSVFETGGGNSTPGINTQVSVFERQAVFHTED